MTLFELRTRRRDNKRQMETASGEKLRLCKELEDVLAVLIWKMTHRA